MDNLVLLLTDDSEDADILRSVLAAAKDGPFAIEWVRRLADALERVRRGGVDIIFADLFLPDSQGIETFDKLFSAARYVPIMTLSPADSEHVAIEAVQRGAQGYISKGNYQNGLLPQAVRNIIQRKLVEETLFVEKERAQVTLNSIADAVISTDMAGMVTYLNAAAERMTGWSRVEASCWPISHVLNLIDRATLETAPSHVASVIHEDKPMGLNPNTVLIRRDGYEIAIEDSLAPIHDRNGRITGTVMVFHDAK
jgi:PAS domain S-box-containing protein